MSFYELQWNAKKDQAGWRDKETGYNCRLRRVTYKKDQWYCGYVELHSDYPYNSIDLLEDDDEADEPRIQIDIEISLYGDLDNDEDDWIGFDTQGTELGVEFVVEQCTKLAKRLWEIEQDAKKKAFND